MPLIATGQRPKRAFQDNSSSGQSYQTPGAIGAFVPLPSLVSVTFVDAVAQMISKNGSGRHEYILRPRLA